MSYDVYINCHTCGHKLNWRDNITSGAAAVWKQAGIDLDDYNNLTALQLIGPLQHAINTLKREPDEYLQYEAQLVDGTLQFLEQLRDTCAVQLDATVHVTH